MFKQELEVACQAAMCAGDAIMEVYQTAFSVDIKSPDQPVTEADRRSNVVIYNHIHQNFPQDGWLSEETVDDEIRLKKNRVWIVDPLDGTKEFISKVPEFAVSIGLQIDGEAVVGVIYNPVTKEMFSAQKGGGAFLNGMPIRVSEQSQLLKAVVLASRSESKRGEWKPYEGEFIISPSGGMAHKMTQVASGKADASFSLTPKNEWDFCAGVILVQEAGGRATLPSGEALIFNKQSPLVPGILYSNKNLYDAFLNRIHP